MFFKNLRWHLLCLFVKHLVCDTEDETFGTASLSTMPPSGGASRGSGPRGTPGRRTKCGLVTTACVCHRLTSSATATYVYGESGPSRTFDTSCWPRVIRSRARL